MSNVPPTGRTWARAEIKCSLQLPSGARSPGSTPRCWYFEIPSTHDTPERWQELVARITLDINTALRRRQPDDLAWIDVESIKVYPVRPRQVLTGPETDPRSLSWQITPLALTKAITDPDPAAAKRAFDAMMEMQKIDIAAIEAARRG